MHLTHLSLVPALVNIQDALPGSFLWTTWPQVWIDRKLTCLGITLHHFWWINTPAPSPLIWDNWGVCPIHSVRGAPQGLSPRCSQQKCAHSDSQYLLPAPPYLTSLLLHSCFLESPSKEAPALKSLSQALQLEEVKSRQRPITIFFNMTNTLISGSPPNFWPNLLHSWFLAVIPKVGA